MEESIVWVIVLGGGFGIYVLTRLARLTQEVEALKARLGPLTRPAAGRSLQGLAEALDARRGSAGEAVAAPPPVSTPDSDPPPLSDFVIEHPGPMAVPPIIARPPSVPIHAAPSAGSTPPRTSPPPGSNPQRAPGPPPSNPTIPPVIARPFEVETVLGANWMAKLGIAAIAVSVAYFLQYAFRNGWIRPWGQVGIGLCGAALMMGAGQVLLAKERFRSYAQVLFSGGIVVYFLSIYAAYHFYQPALIDYWPAIGALAIGAVAASALALANGTEAVAIICILGAFAAPALIRDQTGPPSTDGLLKLYVYLAAINLWAAAFIRFRAWYSVAVTSFFCTWLLFLAAGPVANGGWRVEAFATLFLLSAVWTGVKTLFVDPGAQPDEPRLKTIGAGVIVAACAVYVFASASILDGSYTFGLPDVVMAGTVVGMLLAALAVALPDPSGDLASYRKAFSVLSAFASGFVMSAAVFSAPPVPRGMIAPSFAFSLLNYGVFLAMALWMQKRNGLQESSAILTGINALVYIATVLHVLARTTWAGVPAACLWLPAAGASTLSLLCVAGRKSDSPGPFPATLGIAGLVFVLSGLLKAVGPLSRGIGPHWPAGAVWILAMEFLASSVLWLVLRHRVAWSTVRLDAIGVSNSVFYFLVFACALGTQKSNGLSPLAACAVLFALWHALVGLIALDRDDDNLLRTVHFGAAVTFLAIAVPLQLEMAWITVGWAVEGAALVWAGCSSKSAAVRRFGYATLAVAAGRALTVDLTHPLEPFRFLLNGRMLAGVSVVVASYCSAWRLSQNRDALTDGERDAASALTVLANLFSVTFVSWDLWQRFAGTTPTGSGSSGQHLALTLFWSLYAVATVCVATMKNSRPLRLFGVGLLGLSITKAMAMDLLTDPARFALLANTRVFGGMALVAAACACAALLWQQKEELPESEHSIAGALVLAANGLTLAFVSRDLWQNFGGELTGVVSAQQLALSIFWALYGLAAICAGIWTRNRPARLFAMGLLYVAIFKVFLLDLRELETPYRIASFFTLGVVFLLVSYLYTRFEERMREEEDGHSAPSPQTPPATGVA